MNVKLNIENNYGKKALYIRKNHDKETNTFYSIHTGLTGKRTISKSDIECYKILGVTFEIVAPSLEDIE